MSDVLSKKDNELLLIEKRVFELQRELAKNSNANLWMDKQGIRAYEELLEKSQDFEWFCGEAANDLVNGSNILEVQ